MTTRPVALVADDHELFGAGLSSVLKDRLGFSCVHQAGSLDDAVEILGQDQAISFATFDLNMSGVVSAACLQGVRDAFPSIRIAVVAGSTCRDDILMALAAGVHGYVPKSLSIDGVVDALRMVIDGHVYVPASVSEASRPSVDKTVGPPPPPPPPPAPALDHRTQLTRRQREVLDCIAQGKSNKEIARMLDLADGTVKVHVAALFRVLGVHNRVSAATALMRLGVHGRPMTGGTDVL